MEIAATKRIDAGIPRGPRKNSRVARGLTPKPRPEDRGTWQIPANLNPDEVIAKYLTEATTSQIAASYGLSRRALVKWLRQERPNEWKEAQLIRAHVRLEDGEDGLDGSADALSLARAREQAKAAQWRLQALDNDYHPKQELTITDKTDLGDRLRRSRERVIEGESTVIAAPHQVTQVIEPTSDAPHNTGELPE